jgi:diguanylate cyclase (GGDEF)-like protein/PAS domain S-box-containing protein
MDGLGGNGEAAGRARQAGWLLVAAGLFTIANNYLPGAGHLDVAVLDLVGLAAVAIGLFAHLLPWRRWPGQVPLVFAPIAFALIALANRFGGVSPFSYATYFVLTFTWIGLAFPPRTSFLLAPLATAAYVLPGLTTAHGPAGSVSSVTVAIPVCLLVAETISRTVRKLRDAMRDATDQKERYERLVELSQQGVWEVDAHAHTVFVNQAMAEMLGYTPAEMIGRSVFDFLDAEVRTAAAANLERRRLGITEELDFPFCHKDGHEVWTAINTRPILGPGGDYLGAIGTVVDITEKRRREMALREAEERFRQAFINAPIGMALTSLDGQFLQVNGALCEMLGRPPVRLVGASVRSLTHHEDRDADQAAMREMREGQRRTFATEKRYRRADGEPVWARLHAAVVADGAGRPLYFVSQMEDITERKRAEAALLASEERTRRILETAGDAFVALDEGGRITAWNGQAELTFGWRADEVVGRLLEEVVTPPALREAHRWGLAHFRATGDGPGPALGRRLELIALHRDGREIPVELVVSGLREGDGWSFNAFVRDVSQRKALEEELQRLALVDELTGLRNRRGFLAVAESLIAVAHRNQRDMALLYVDLDNMKEINDRYGHGGGDRALVETANLLRATFRESDVVARLGGDEFCVLLPEDGTEAKAVIDRLTEEVSARAREAAGPEPTISLSIGIATYRWDDPCPIEALIDRADAAMYEQKAHKRRVVEVS